MKNANIKVFAGFIFFIIAPLISFGQGELNNFLKKMSNNQLEFYVAKVGISQISSPGKIELPKNLAFIESQDLNKLLLKVGKNRIIKACVKLLNDTTRDWYANVLLYQITKKDATPLIVVTTRDEWVSRSKNSDVYYWINFFKK